MFYENKRVLVTGGSGFVGTHLIKRLLDQGANIRVPIHERAMIVKDERIELVQADLTRAEDCLRVTEGVDYVFHAAGAVSSAANKAPIAAITTNLVLTSRVVEAAWAQKVTGLLLFSSSTGYPAFDHAVKEEEMWVAPPYEGYFGYGWMRRFLEILGEFATQKTDMKVAVVRPTAVYGRYDNFDPKASHVIPALINRAVQKENPYVVWGGADVVRDFLHIDDLARGCLMMMENTTSFNPTNIGYGKYTTVGEIVQIILKATNHADAKVIFDTSKPTAIPIRMVDCTKAKEEFGFEPTISLEEGLTDTVNWYLSQLKL